MKKISLFILLILTLSTNSAYSSGHFTFVNKTPYTIGFRMVTVKGGHSYDPVTLEPGKSWETDEDRVFHIDLADDWDNADKNEQWMSKAKKKNRDWGLSFEEWQYRFRIYDYKADFIWNPVWQAPQLIDTGSGKKYDLQ